MAEPGTSFHDFEHQGWSVEDVAAGYHDYLSPVTTQAIGSLLDAARVGRGTRVVDVATGVGYAAAAERGAMAIGSTSPPPSSLSPVDNTRPSISVKATPGCFRSRTTASMPSS